MRRAAACLVLAVAVTGCGSSEPGWQEEFQDSSRQLVNDPELFPVAALLQSCTFLIISDEMLERDDLELIKPAMNAVQSLRLDEILTDYGVELTPAVLDEAIQIIFDEIVRACP